MNIKKLFDLSGRTIIITGAAGLLGSQYADGLSQVGANVVLADISLPQCKILEKNIKNKYSTNPFSVKLDLTKQSSIKSMVSSIKKKYSKIDVLVNNAAYQGNKKIRSSGFENLKLDTWNQAIDVNLTGVFLCVQEVGKKMLKQKKFQRGLKDHGFYSPELERKLKLYYESREFNFPTKQKLDELEYQKQKECFLDYLVGSAEISVLLM